MTSRIKLKLYSGPLSLFTAKVRIALAEKGLDYDRVEVGWSLADRYEPHHPEVVALNPKHEVPVLVDGDRVVYDSTLILEYLQDRNPEPRLYPDDVAGRARCRQLEQAADEILFPAVWALIDEVFYPKPEDARDEARIEEARQTIASFHAALDKALADRDYLCGEFSVADIGCYVFLNAAANLGSSPADEASPHAQLRAWYQRTGERPAVANETQAMMAYLAATMAGGATA
jgi:glutathione S-transferase